MKKPLGGAVAAERPKTGGVSWRVKPEPQERLHTVLALDPPQGLAEVALDGTFLWSEVVDSLGALDSRLRALLAREAVTVEALAFEEQCLRSRGRNLMRSARDRKAMRAEGVVLAVAETYGLQCFNVSAKCAQARLVGHQGAKDREIRDAVEKRFGVRPKTQHETEALAVAAEALIRLRKGRAKR